MKTPGKSITAFLLLLAAACLFQAAPVFAQAPAEDEIREKYVTEIRQYKHDYLASELELSREQQREFFPLYDEMEDRLMKLGAETRELERKAAHSKDASDVELEAAIDAVYSQKSAEGEIEKSYLEKFKKILTNRQILRLKNAERKFTQRLMREHRKARQGQRQPASTGDSPSRRQK